MSSPSSELIHEIVRAGAGAGKTTRLTQKVLRLAKEFYASEGRWPNIVVSTFTRKATQELRERLILGACQQDSGELLQFVADKSRLHISTIHGVLSLFIRQYGHLIDIDPNFSILAEQESRRLKKSIIRDLVVGNKDYAELFEAFSLTELSQIMGPFFEWQQNHEDLRFATKSDFIHLADREISSLKDKWWSYIEEVAETAVGDEKWAECFSVLQTLADQLSLNSIHNQDWYDRFSQVKKPRNSKKSPVSDEDHERFKELKATTDKLVSGAMFDPEFWQKTEVISEKISKLNFEFQKQWREHKKLSGLLEMSDLELFVVEALKNEPQLGGAFASQWDYWLIDEYQDTSPTQIRLLKGLCGDAKRFLVGDPQQSIYLFRGARSQVFFESMKLLSDAGEKVSRLGVNYRSEPNLLLFMNHLLTGFSDQFSAMEPHPDKVLQSAEEVATITLADEAEDEYAAIAERITKLLDRGVAPQEIAVLMRKHRSLEKLAHYLGALNLPIQVHANAGFSKRREILDSWAFLKFLVNPFDNLRLLQLVRSPWLKISDQDLARALSGDKKSAWEKLQENLSDHSVVQKMQALHKQVREKGVLAVFEESLVAFGLLDTSFQVDSTGRRESNLWKLLDQLHQESKQPGFNWQRFTDENASVITDIDKDDGDGDAVAALEPNRIQLMTVHASKGLQFEHVFIPEMQKEPSLSSSRHSEIVSWQEDTGLWTLRIPFGEENKKTANLHHRTINSENDEREVAEHERLFYVAVTRAKKSLYLSWSGKVKAQSWAEKLSINLDEGEHKSENFSYRVQRWDKTVTKAQDWKPREEIQPRAAWQDLSSVESVKEKLSVSALLDDQEFGGASGPKQSLAVDSMKSSLLLRSEGVLLHELLEKLSYDPDLDILSYAESRFSGDLEAVGQAIDFCQGISEFDFMSLVQDGHVEWGFQIPVGERILEGQIDLWGEQGENIYVVDYKSGSERHVDKAMAQLDLYSLALHELGLNKKIWRVVIYPLRQSISIKEFSGAENVRKRHFLVD